MKLHLWLCYQILGPKVGEKLLAAFYVIWDEDELISLDWPSFTQAFSLNFFMQWPDQFHCSTRIYDILCSLCQVLYDDGEKNLLCIFRIEL